jgi:hypothetical protein
MRRASRFAVALAALPLASTFGCADQCVVVPTWVDIVADRYYLKAPGDVAFTAVTQLGVDTCGPSPTEVTAYHWRLDGEPLEADEGGPLGEAVSVHFDAPGAHVVQVRIEDDLGAELPVVGRASVLVY